MTRQTKSCWRAVFSRVNDDEDGQPRFYIRGTREHLFAFDGYMATHQNLNEILEFLGSNTVIWAGSGSPMNVSSYEYVDYFDPDEDGGDDRIEIYFGKYMLGGNAQGAYIVGFRLFRALISHLRLTQPRKLRGEFSSRVSEPNNSVSHNQMLVPR
jgi:hypothetical protein